MAIILDGHSLTLSQFVAVCRNEEKAELSDSAIELINNSRKVVDDIVNGGKVVYGITTGFGKFENVVVSADETSALQHNLIVSHAVGAGEPFPVEVARGMLLLRVNSLSHGHSGIRLSTVKTMLDMLNKGVTPYVPSKGSLGASGDLAPLSHMVLPMLGLGMAYYQGECLPGKEAMDRAGIPTIELAAKEGLALINGTQAMTSVGALAVHDAMELMAVADVAAAMSVEAHRGIIDAYDLRIHRLRPHAGQIKTAQNLNNILKNSKMITRQGDIRVQDAYSFRCVPQVHGASRDAINYVLDKVNIELNSVTDNPIVFEEDMGAISGGNFHGQPMAIAFDLLSIALSELANISERRLERHVNGQLSGLAPFLVQNGGVNSGFMIVQYSAAALVSENKILSHPASVDSIPSSANQEDHVSMGTIGARKAAEVVKNVRRVLAMELMCAAQAVDLRGNLGLGDGTAPVYEKIRAVVSALVEDRPLYEDINACERLIMSGEILK